MISIQKEGDELKPMTCDESMQRTYSVSDEENVKRVLEMLRNANVQMIESRVPIDNGRREQQID